MPRFFSHFMICAMILLSGCSGGISSNNPSAIDVALADIGFAQAGLLEQEIDLSLRFTNPNPFEVATQGLRFDMELDGSQFAKGVANQAVTLPALGEITVPVKVRVATADLVDQLVGLSSGEPLPYEFVGQFFANNSNQEIPFAGNASIRLPEIDKLLQRFGTISN